MANPALPDANSFIAVVEDDPEIGLLVVALLRREGFAAELCRDGVAFHRLCERRRVDLAILDLMLPGEDGLSICRRLHARGDIPVLMVTARAEDVDRVIGLELGADDYLPKPFNPRELLARARAILRRTRVSHRVGTLAPRGEGWRFGGMVLDGGRRTLTGSHGQEIALTGAEFDLLAAFAAHPQRVLSRDQLLDWTRGRDAAPFDRSVDVMVGKLRRQLALDPQGGDLIKTIRGGGYLFAAPVERF
ncbi:MAG: response regulator transcription factor [Sphingomonadales bacterium]|nr:response regulator transcription factor [Sphingomonadales bacterium]MDE2170448.1 response regulator transcription factor [Sphingomonadales bacterium]